MPTDFRQYDEHGFPIPTRFDDPPAEELLPRRRPVNMKTKRLVLIGLLLAVVLPVVFGQQLLSTGRGALARWFGSRAFEKYQAGDLAGALADLDQAIEWNPESWELHWFRARWRAKNNQLDGSLADWSKAITLVQDDNRRFRGRRLRDPSMMLAELHAQRSWIYVRLNQADEAIEDANRAVNLYADAACLNCRAYARAVLNVELEQGLADIEQAIAKHPGKSPDMLDTRGYLLHRLGRDDEALEVMNEAIRITQSRRGRLMGRGFSAAEAEQEHRHSLAVMYHHRGLIHEKLGNQAEAEADLRRADAYGYDPANGVL